MFNEISSLRYELQLNGYPQNVIESVSIKGKASALSVDPICEARFREVQTYNKSVKY
jgi:hypothetical protein